MKINILSKEFAKSNISDLIRISKEIPFEYWEKEHFLFDLSKKWDYSLVAVNEITQKVLGFIICSQKEEFSIHIHKFAVEKESQSKKIGYILLEKLEKECYSTQIRKITLKVHVSNIRAINFYLKNGFVQKETKEDLLILNKIL